MRLVRAGVLIASAAVLAGGCGTATIKAGGAERSVADVVAQKTGFRPTDVRCPSGIPAKVGKTFDCHFTGPEPRPYVAHVRIAKVQGQNVVFFVSTQPTG